MHRLHAGKLQRALGQAIERFHRAARGRTTPLELRRRLALAGALVAAPRDAHAPPPRSIVRSTRRCRRRALRSTRPPARTARAATRPHSKPEPGVSRSLRACAPVKPARRCMRRCVVRTMRANPFPQSRVTHAPRPCDACVKRVTIGTSGRWGDRLACSNRHRSQDTWWPQKADPVDRPRVRRARRGPRHPPPKPCRGRTPRRPMRRAPRPRHASNR